MIHRCELCGEPMPSGEEMFKFHGHSGPCPVPVPGQPPPPEPPAKPKRRPKPASSPYLNVARPGEKAAEEEGGAGDHPA